MSETAIVWAATWIWQAMVLTIVVAAALKLAPAVSAATRFVVWWTALVAVLTLIPLAIPERGWVEPGPASDSPASETVPAAPTLQSDVRPAVMLVPQPPLWLVPLLACAWAAAVGRRLIGLIREVTTIADVKRRCASVPWRLERRLPLWAAARAQGRQARLGVSRDVAAASMLGFGTPVIAVSNQIIESLSRDDLDRIVLHEYAHVQRRDDWTGGMQVIIEALFAWHPAVWWIGRQLRLEREVACDDWVVARTATPHTYAKCLTRVAGVAHTARRRALALGVVRSRRTLSVRVDRLLDSNRRVTLRPTRAAVAASTVGLAVAATALGLLPPLLGIVDHDGAAFLPASPVSTIVTAPREISVRGLASLRRSEVADTVRSPAPPPTERRAPIPDVALADLILMPLELERRPSHSEISEAPRLTSRDLRFDTVTIPEIPANRGYRADPQQRVEQPGRAPWMRVADAGRAVGGGATRASRATVIALREAGLSIARLFR